MNLEMITLQDCIEMCLYKGDRTVIGDGTVTGFCHEKETVESVKDVVEAYRKFAGRAA